MYLTRLTVTLSLQKYKGEKLSFAAEFSKEFHMKHPPFIGLEIAFHTEPDGKDSRVLHHKGDDRNPRVATVWSVMYSMPNGDFIVSANEVLSDEKAIALAIEQYETILGFSRVAFT